MPGEDYMTRTTEVVTTLNIRSNDFSRFPTLEFEQALWKGGFEYVAGIDEAGRGALAGPVSAAAVVLPPDPRLALTLRGVRDSKQMTPPEREAWAPRIREAALAWGIGFASAAEIDSLGIVPATKLAAWRAIQSLSSPHPPPAPQLPLATAPLLPDYLLTDYLVFPELELPQTAIIKGDQKSLSVAAASVLAKTSRDAIMRDMEADYPDYGFGRHKGYGTQVHRLALLRLGKCAIHRQSFAIPAKV
jgi:ribonuclease HII